MIAHLFVAAGMRKGEDKPRIMFGVTTQNRVPVLQETPLKWRSGAVLLLETPLKWGSGVVLLLSVLVTLFSNCENYLTFFCNYKLKRLMKRKFCATFHSTSKRSN